MDSLTDFAKAQFVPAQKIIADGRECTPILIFICGDGAPGIAGVPEYGNPEAKGELRTMMRAILRSSDAAMYAFVMEAWLGTQPKGRVKPGYRPSKDPERIEAICVSAASKGGEKVFFYVIINREGGKVSFSEPKSFDAAGGIDPLLHLLDDAETVH